MKKIIQSQTLQNQAYDYLFNKIVSGELPPGERLIEEKIAKETEISRSPIREAIRRLTSEGLVSVNPRGGVRVYQALHSDFKYLYECRKSLEPTAASLAAKRMNEVKKAELNKLVSENMMALEDEDYKQLKIVSSRFHELILEGSGNPYLIKLMKQLNSLLMFYRNKIVDISQRLEKGSIEHQDIWRAIQKGDEEDAEKRMREHIEIDYQFYISKYGENDKGMKTLF
ncbi:GntR family transcriptional regulator [Alteribacillus bidgolensis]|uniref:Transcriptional regulator, GntR family n=1 Tax=Alteribacillus bidgolensis TaxID=930129 RepID=A0A1G8I9X5_9BACI|nr:GntR family transcriptional regulator [Alteribacillus bidgolensis]SDI15662.1 transcriptional regulator, GntR family [Alteribacillus bidgolensis]